jgi:hypothetical protein
MTQIKEEVDYLERYIAELREKIRNLYDELERAEVKLQATRMRLLDE